MRADYLAVSVTDALAAERTVLAGGRTFLPYLRSAFAVFVAVVTRAQVVEAEGLLAVAYALAIIAPLVLLVGVQRLRASRRVVAELLARMANERRRSGA